MICFGDIIEIDEWDCGHRQTFANSRIENSVRCGFLFIFCSVIFLQNQKCLIAPVSYSYKKENGLILAFSASHSVLDSAIQLHEPELANLGPYTFNHTPNLYEIAYIS
jgi:hypothetical protein